MLTRDLGALGVLKEFQYKALDIQHSINRTIVMADPDLHPNCIQWKMSYCASVALVLTDESGYQWIATIKKPSGPFEALADYLRPRLPGAGGVYIHLACM